MTHLRKLYCYTRLIFVCHYIVYLGHNVRVPLTIVKVKGKDIIFSVILYIEAFCGFSSVDSWSVSVSPRKIPVQHWSPASLCNRLSRPLASSSYCGWYAVVFSPTTILHNRLQDKWAPKMERWYLLLQVAWNDCFLSVLLFGVKVVEDIIYQSEL